MSRKKSVTRQKTGGRRKAKSQTPSTKRTKARRTKVADIKTPDTKTGAIKRMVTHLRGLSPLEIERAIELGVKYQEMRGYGYPDGNPVDDKDVLVLPQKTAERVLQTIWEDDRLGFGEKETEWPDQILPSGRVISGEPLMSDEGEPMWAIAAMSEDWFDSVDDPKTEFGRWVSWDEWQRTESTKAELRRNELVEALVKKYDDGWSDEPPHELTVIIKGRAKTYYNIPQELLKDATPYKFTPKKRLGLGYKMGRPIITLMNPREYLDMMGRTYALPRDPEGNIIRTESVKYIADRYKEGYRWGSIPFIDVDKFGMPISANHEGRHRAYVMMTEYPEQKIPVVIYDRSRKADGISMAEIKKLDHMTTGRMRAAFNEMIEKDIITDEMLDYGS